MDWSPRSRAPNRCSRSPPPGNGRLWSNLRVQSKTASRAFRPFIGLIRFFGRFPTLSASARHRPRAAAVASVRTSAQPGSRERSLPPTAQFRSMGGWSGRRPGLHRRPQAAPRRTSQGPPNHEPPSRQGGHGRGPRRASARPRVRPRLVQAANP